MADYRLDQDKLKRDQKMDQEELNGDKSLDTKLESAGKRKMRKLESNSTRSVETDAKATASGFKRKYSETSGSAEDELEEFIGFSPESIAGIQAGLQIIQKLIVEAELEETHFAKRKRGLWKGPQKNLEWRKATKCIGKSNIDNETIETITINENPKHKDEKYQETIDLQNLDSNNLSSEGASDGSQKVEMSNILYKKPFKFGWKRELIYKDEIDGTQKRPADIYYYSPKGKKVKSLREVAECLISEELTLDNFTFCKESIGIDDPSLEMIRDAKRPRLESTNIQTTPFKKSMHKRATVAKKAPTPPPTPPKVVEVSSKVTISAGLRVKVYGKRVLQKKEVKPSIESEMLPPMWSSATVTRRSQVAEKVTSPKNRRLLKAKLQEPCSIRCSMSMGLIPSLQCRICLCLYHPECVDGKSISTSEEYVCKNCQMELEPSERLQQSRSITPPALIPISMLGSQAVKSKLYPSKTQQSQKPVSERPFQDKLHMLNTSGIASVIDKVDTSLSSWLPQTGKEFLHSHDGSKPKPAQNIAKMGGKRYIIVPKNNDMAVQPAIPIRPDRSFGNQRNLIEEYALINQQSTSKGPINRRRSPQLNIKCIRDKENEIADRDTQGMESEGLSNNSMNKDESTPPNEVKDTRVEPAVQTMEVHMDVEAVELDKNLELESLDDLHVLGIKSELIETDKNVLQHELMHGKPDKNKSNRHVQTTIAIPGMPPEDTKEQEIENLNTKCDSSTKKKMSPAKLDSKQHFMVSVCAGYHALSRIFQYLTVQELLRAARVCRMWRDLAVHQALWKTVRMKNSPVTDWDGLAASLKRHGTQHLDLRKMLIAEESDNIWDKFVSILPNIPSLITLQLCKCPASVVEEIFTSCPQLEILSAMAMKCDTINIETLGNLKRLKEVRLKAISGISLQKDLSPLEKLKHLTQLNLTSIKELGKKKIEILKSLINLQTLELGECSDFPETFGTDVLLKLTNLTKLRLEKGQGSCCTFDMLEGVSKLENLHQLELVNFDVKNGFDKCLANCKNLKRLLIIPTYISQSATSNNMVLGGVTELSDSLTHFVWGVTLELLRVTELFVDQCNETNKQVSGDSIPVLKPVPCLTMLKDTEEEQDASKEAKQSNVTDPQVDILPLPQLQKLLLTALPKTRVKILKIPFHATWRQGISDTTSQKNMSTELQEQ